MIAARRPHPGPGRSAAGGFSQEGMEPAENLMSFTKDI